MTIYIGSCIVSCVRACVLRLSVSRHGLSSQVHPNRFVWPGHTPSEIANAALNPSQAGEQQRKALVPYLERFTHFFSADFIVEKFVLAVAADDSCRRCLQLAFDAWEGSAAARAEQQTVMEWMYHGDEFTFDITRAQSFLAFLGIFDPVP